MATVARATREKLEDPQGITAKASRQKGITIRSRSELQSLLAELDDEQQEQEPAGPTPQQIADRRSLAKAGTIRTASDMAELMTALMYDVLAGTVSPGEASAVINAGRQTLRLVELSLRYEISGATELMSVAARVRK